jgi:FtsP/CotA-like multicopper oxidase with cupredoxin domain
MKFLPFAAAKAAFAVAVCSGLAAAQLPGGSLDPTSIPKFRTSLTIPPAMPRKAVLDGPNRSRIDYYEIAVRQFRQQVLPPGMPKTTVWGYGAPQQPGTLPDGGSFNYPACTIEARFRRPVRVKWINDLCDAQGRYLPHLLPIDQTLHWSNPVGPRDQVGADGSPYAGPVPMIPHVHGAETSQESDGYPEAWTLPNAVNIPASYFRTGTYYDLNKASSPLGALWSAGNMVFEYPNDQAATTLWYHDHSLGMTRANIYAGPAGFYLLRGGPGDEVQGRLPAPAPGLGDPSGMSYREIPILIQDRSFNLDGSLFYPSDRAFFEGLTPAQLQIPFKPTNASDVSPLWNPEFFGNTMVVNGRTWPYMTVEKRRYRLRLLNGCDSRFLILKFSNGLPFWQIGAEGGFLPQPIQRTELLLEPAGRADVIVDFSAFPEGANVRLLNIGPDEPFGGGVPDLDFLPSDPNTTGQVMQFRIVRRTGVDGTTRPEVLGLPAQPHLGAESVVRQVSLNEMESSTILVTTDVDGNIVLDPSGVPFGPTMAALGTVNPDGTGNPLPWGADVTEDPSVGATEIWEINNFTEDAHPVHIHQVQFEVVGRIGADGVARGPEAWETGYTDTVTAYPGEVTRVKARFDLPGLFTWHCHIVSHEDNEMMRPFRVSPPAGP